MTGNPWDVAVDAPADDAAAVEAVLDATPGVEAWFTEREQTGTVDGDGFTVRLDRAARRTPPQYVVQEGRPISADDEAIVGYGFLDATGLDVGDPLTVELDGTSLDLTIVGWYSDTADTGKIIQVREEALPAVRPGRRPDWRVVADDGGRRRGPRRRPSTPSWATTPLAEPLTVDGPRPGAGGRWWRWPSCWPSWPWSTSWPPRSAAPASGPGPSASCAPSGCSTRQLVGQSAVGAGAIGLLAGLVGVPLGLGPTPPWPTG